MDPVTLTAVVSTVAAAASAGGSAWLQARVRQQRYDDAIGDFPV